MQPRTILLGLKTSDGETHLFGEDARAVPCFRCGLCCVNFLIKLTTRDIRLLSHGLGLSRRDFLKKYVKKTVVGPVLQQNGDSCVFLSSAEGKTCAGCDVYESRPEVCRSWVPGLDRPECQEGLRRLAKSRPFLLPADIYLSEDDILRLCSVLDDNSRTT